MINVLRKVFNSLVNVKTEIILREVKKNITFQGKGHRFNKNSRVYLHWGSTKDDIIMNEYSELFGSLLSFNHGKITMGKWSKVGNSVINCVNSIEIGDDVAIADGCVIVDHNFHPINPEDRKYMRHTPHNSKERAPMFSANAPIKIGNNVWIGSNVRVCKGVTIGENSVIGANSIVVKSIPSNCVAVGNPAKVVKENIDKTTTPIFPLSNENLQKKH